MKTYRIAFCGVFDLINYGDHLFPSIFEDRITSISFELSLFSVTSLGCTFSGPYEVYALKNLEAMHLVEPFDAIIVSGGALIHFRTISQRLDISSEVFKDYPIFETWIIPSVISYIYGIPLLWDCPGVPYDFEPPFDILAQTLIDVVDYIAVRNEPSRQSLVACGVARERILVYPDTAFVLPQVYPKSMLEELKQKLVGTHTPYVVFHCHKNIPESMLLQSIEVLQGLEMQHYKVVLLPLAYTHADEQCLQQLREMCQNAHFYIPEHMLNMVEMMALLANCHLYIGVSFHGAITAFAYGAKTIAIDFFHYRKTKALYDQMGRSRYYLTDTQNLKQTVESCLADNTDDSICRDRLTLAVNRHFEGMCQVLQTLPNKLQKKNMIYSISTLCTKLYNTTSDVEQSKRENIWLEEHSAILENYAKSLEDQKAWLEEHSTILENYVKSLEDQKAWLEERSTILENYTKSLEDQVAWWKAHSTILEGHIKRLEDQMV